VCLGDLVEAEHALRLGFQRPAFDLCEDRLHRNRAERIRVGPERISDYGYEHALVGFDGCLRRLGLD
jgi:hypothetical protein